MCTILEGSVTDIIKTMGYRDRIKRRAVLERTAIDTNHLVHKPHIDSRQPFTILKSAITYLVNQIVVVVIRYKDVSRIGIIGRVFIGHCKVRGAIPSWSIMPKNIQSIDVLNVPWISAVIC